MFRRPRPLFTLADVDAGRRPEPLQLYGPCFLLDLQTGDVSGNALRQLVATHVRRCAPTLTIQDIRLFFTSKDGSECTACPDPLCSGCAVPASNDVLVMPDRQSLAIELNREIP